MRKDGLLLGSVSRKSEVRRSDVMGIVLSQWTRTTMSEMSSCLLLADVDIRSSPLAEGEDIVDFRSRHI